MESLEVNKACAAVLVAGIAFMVAGVIGDALIHPRRLDTSAIKIEVSAGGGAPAPIVAADPPVAVELDLGRPGGG